MSGRKTRNSLEKSNRSEQSFVTGEPESEHFWSIELNAEKRSYTWTTTADLDDDDEDFVDHTLFLRQAVLGTGAVAKEENIVTMESMGAQGEAMKGTIANLSKGINSMSPLELTVPGKSGATFTLAEGSGPVFINGAQLVEFPKNDLLLNQSQESELSEDMDDEEEEEVELKPVKRKGPIMTNGKDKQKAKMDVEDEDDDEIDEEDEEDDEDDEDVDDDLAEEDSEESPAAKKSKKKAPEVVKGKPVKEVKKATKEAVKKTKASKK